MICSIRPLAAQFVQSLGQVSLLLFSKEFFILGYFVPQKGGPRPTPIWPISGHIDPKKKPVM
jgi:hypothetical protein